MRTRRGHAQRERIEHELCEQQPTWAGFE